MPPFPIPDIALPDPEPRKTRSGSAASLHLARSRSSLGSSDEAGLLVSGGAGRRRASFALTPISPARGKDEESDDGDDDRAPPLTPSTLEANTARWAAEQAAAAPDVDVEAHPRISLSHRVQFADEDDVEVFDAAEADGFEKPVGSEMMAIVLSCSALAVIATAAALTTMYDWVL
ncbi:hypothetical protein Q8F55_003962 [Vanrija albida]|uniref:Uncharacterized protein n=1 Tax=Vanrija albida TaxID=181172 RepID=A0ABR3Q5L7_9TREE